MASSQVKMGKHANEREPSLSSVRREEDAFQAAPPASYHGVPCMISQFNCLLWFAGMRAGAALLLCRIHGRRRRFSACLPIFTCVEACARRSTSGGVGPSNDIRKFLRPRDENHVRPLLDPSARILASAAQQPREIFTSLSVRHSFPTLF